MEINETPKFKLYNIGDLSKTTFRYHSNDTKRNLTVYTLPFPLQLSYKPLGILQRVTKSEKVHISRHDKLQKLHNINFAWHRP